MSQFHTPSQEELSRVIEVDVGEGVQSMRYGDAIALADRFISNSRPRRAGALLKQLIDLFPNDIVPRAQLLHLLVNERDHVNSIRLADEILPGLMDNSTIVALGIRGYRQAGQTETALDLARRAAAAFPQDSRIQNEVGLCFIASGDKEQAADAFNNAIDIEPTYVAPYMGRARIRAGKLSEAQIATMEDAASRPGLSQEDRAIMQFSLAWAFAGKDPDRHFEHLQLGNSIIAQERPWDANAAKLYAERLKAFFSPELIEKATAAGTEDMEPIFIIGVPRSGTSLVEQIVSVHDDVTGCGETGAFEFAVRHLSRDDGRLAPIWTWPDAADPARYFGELDSLYRQRLRAFDVRTPRFTDKSLGAEWWCAVLLTMYPRAKVVHCQRNPLDSCLSMYQLHFSVGQEFSYSLAWIAHYLRIHADLMEYWKRAFPGRIMTFEYEHLIGDQEHQTRSLLDFCNLSWQEQCLNFHESKRTARTASDFQIKQPLYSSSIGRWKPYAMHLREAATILGLDVDHELEDSRIS